MKSLSIVFFVVMLFCASISAQTTTFTFQGSMKDGASPANGNYDFEFKLFDSVSAGTQQGGTIQRLNVAVANGIFTVSLDFGAGTLPGADRFLDIGVRTAGGGAFTALSPRQKVNSAPYSVRSLNSTTADVATNATQLGGVAANQYVITTDPRMTDARTPTAGSANYVQNTTSLQSLSNFNVSGTGTANVVNAVSEYRIGTFRVLSTLGTNNLFVGVGAGTANNVGVGNTFVGRDAGAANTAGTGNTFFGRSAGQANVTSGGNSFFGSRSGEANTSVDNSFFGASAGTANTNGDSNSFFGKNAGQSNTTGGFNSFFGTSAGSINNGGLNSFFGAGAGFTNLTGFGNAFVGTNAGDSNTTGDNNTIIGFNADVGSGNLNYATAIGAGAIVLNNNSIVLGRADGSDFVRVPGVIVLTTLSSAGSTPVCRNGANVISTCSSSLRYKTNINRFGLGLSLVNQLKPITFDWKEGGMHDLGLGAEDVAAIEPLLVTYNDKGDVEGVKYDRISVVLVNAVKEQQIQIEKQQTLIEKQQALIDQLEKRLEQLEKKESR